MAYLTVDTAQSGFWRRFVEKGVGGVEAWSRSISRVDQMERLSSKTDEELAQIGLRREDIAAHVFRDVLFV